MIATMTIRGFGGGGTLIWSTAPSFMHGLVGCQLVAEQIVKSAAPQQAHSSLQVLKDVARYSESLPHGVGARGRGLAYCGGRVVVFLYLLGLVFEIRLCILFCCPWIADDSSRVCHERQFQPKSEQCEHICGDSCRRTLYRLLAPPCG